MTVPSISMAQMVPQLLTIVNSTSKNYLCAASCFAATSENYLGTSVTVPGVDGSNGLVAAVKGKVNGSPSERLLLSTKSSQKLPKNLTIDFFKDKHFVSGHPCLGISIKDGIIVQGEDSRPKEWFSASVGPSSIELLADTTNLNAALGGFMDTFLDVAKKIAPVVAEQGLEILKNVCTTEYKSKMSVYEKVTLSKDDEIVFNALGGWFDTVLSVAKIAGPIAASILI